ncbi:DJ-1 family glyoxalase III [Mycoplasma feriruminatoris]|uniref:Protein/nucleic acid deglycase 3 n=1 Tax=Mycoplasma feriruminatoris TaxID=1179777 RepID=A0AAQ3DNJ4_9MOLU|nr:DJ-1 family glyoxalase III [Mycoplasma feriruminatoris]UKS54156.1 DJ-1 family protein [Mycoplasma feriruminatoris]WFQ90213.1 Protein/nucleic acid deglycase 3 [Mycoplasma feriruminatoris]WFQ91037.1 ThiJ/PfpI family protein [Mycoplasma feriruminatoris]WFQ91859.1 Protein/nucleic acid deglycase 3 [Mycoplasma feriruminatoris]WFQ92700.1 Protein/nucleic acid deglycase 3 [Mycoplasma feriruminatoris]
MKKIALYLNPGFEEIEAVTVCDVLKRAGILVDMVSTINQLEVKGSHNIVIRADKLWKDLNVNYYDGMVLPGGSGVTSLFDNQTLIDNILEFNKNNKLIASICAAPQVIGQTKLLDNKTITHYPNCNFNLSKANVVNQPYVVDSNFITGASAGSSMLFSLAIVEYLLGKEKKEEIYKSLVIFG